MKILLENIFGNNSNDLFQYFHIKYFSKQNQCRIFELHSQTFTFQYKLNEILSYIINIVI